MKYLVLLLLPIMAISDQGIIAYWDFDCAKSNVIADRSGNNNQIYPGDELYIPYILQRGRYGKAIHLDKTVKYAGVIPDPQGRLWNLSDTFTVSLWIEALDYNQNAVIISYRQNDAGWTLGLTSDGYMVAQKLVAGKKTDFAVSSSALISDEFNHVAVVYSRDKGPVAIYLNGEIKETKQRQAWSYMDRAGFLLGRRIGNLTAKKFNGAIDDLCIFEGVLKEDMILNISKNVEPLSVQLNLIAVDAVPDNESVYFSKVYTAQELGLQLRRNIEIGGVEVNVSDLPQNFKVDENCSLLVHRLVSVQKIHAWPVPRNRLDIVRSCVAPNGDWLIFFAGGACPYGPSYEKLDLKTNDMLLYRSKDKGKTWMKPVVPWDTDYPAGFGVPFIPKGKDRLYFFGSEAVPYSRYRGDVNRREDAAIAYRYSDDSGGSWSEPVFIRPLNDPHYAGLSGAPMCQTDDGAWLLGTHDGDWSVTTHGPLRTRQYILRSEDEGKTWMLLPGSRPNGWFLPDYERMEEGNIVSLPYNNAYMLCRTASGLLWYLRSQNGGLSFSQPQPTTLKHPDSMPMLYKLSDNKTLISLIHNKYDPQKPHFDQDSRSELWYCISQDNGKTWSRPKFLFANLVSNVRRPSVAYVDMFTDEGKVNFVMPHLWEQVVIVQISEDDLKKMPTQTDIEKTFGK